VDLSDISSARYQGRYPRRDQAVAAGLPRRFRGTKVIDAPKPLLREINHLPQEQHRVVRVMREAILVRLYNVGRG
jgi:hypothetical protein